MAGYIRYTIMNVEPLRIADDSTSQSGQTDTLNYIPGTTMRGFFINQMAKEPDFESVKKTLFSENVCYLNAVLSWKDENGGLRELIPSPKGFYEDKQKVDGPKEILNMLANPDERAVGAVKRAGLGAYCYLQDDCVYYTTPEVDSELNINIGKNGTEKKNIFRSQFLMAGQMFTGYVAVKDDALGKRLLDIMNTRSIFLGSSRSAGFGKCRLIEPATWTMNAPYEAYQSRSIKAGEAYMLLLSNTAMMGANGEITGLDEAALESLLGVSQLKIVDCATSTVQVRGYNRLLNSRIPSVTMYEKGSVFCLKFSGTLTGEKIQSLIEHGIGIRKNEGFGRVLLLDGFERIYKKSALPNYKEAFGSRNMDACTADDICVLRFAAKEMYRNRIQNAMNAYVAKSENILSSMRLLSSQFGVFQSILLANRYQPRNAKQAIDAYLEHAVSKDQRLREQNGKKKNRSKLQEYVSGIWNQSIEMTLGMDDTECRLFGVSKQDLFTEDELTKMKVELLIELIQFELRKNAVTGEKQGGAQS